MAKRLLISALLIGLLLAAAAGMVIWMIQTRPKPRQEDPPRVVPTVPAPRVEVRTNYRVPVVGYGSARPRVRLQIAPQVAGEIVAKAPNFLSGKYVTQGQGLFEIDRTDYVLARDSAQRQIDLLETRLRRLDVEKASLQASEKIERERLTLATEQLQKARALLSRGAAGQNDVDGAEETMLLRKSQLQGVLNQIALIEPQRQQLAAEIALAKVQLAQAETSIARAKVTSPVTGRVLSCDVEVGERVAVGQGCGELYGTDLMEVPVPVPAADLAWIEEPGGAASAPPGRETPDPKEVPAEVAWHQPDNGKEIAWRGKVGRIEAGLAAQTRTATVVVEVRNPRPGGPEPLLDVNMFCRVTILGRTLPEAYVLPRSAVLPDRSVYLVNDGKLVRRPIRVARLAGEEAMLLPGGGVEAGDRVIVGYLPKPVLGMRVQAVDRLAAPGEGRAPAPGR